MEQTKNEPTKENKAAPETGKPKKEREPLTEAQRLKRQKMIVLPAMVLVFIGAMWLIFAPSSGKEQPPGTDGYNTEMPDADKANRQIIGDKLKAYEHGEMEERQESRNRAIGQLGDMFDREIAGTENGVDFDLANPGGKEERGVTRNFAASLFRNIKYFTLRKLYLCRKWMQKRLQKTIKTGITLPNFDFLA